MARQQDIDQALAAREQAAAIHLFDPNVTLVDVGWRIKESAGQEIQPELTVRVHVRRKLHGAAFARFAAAQPQRVVDEDRIGHACDVIESSYGLHAAAALAPLPAAAEVLPRTSAYRPLQGGASGIQQYGTAATLGGFVSDRATGAYMVLSNFHVLAGHAFANPGLATWQPSPYDGGGSGDTVATLVRDAMADSMDAAVAALVDEIEFANYQIGIGPVTGLGEAVLDMPVKKSGRTTGVTAGIVDGIGGSGVLINYGGFSRVIKNVIHIAPTIGPVSAGGDSGSWWLDQDSSQAVALHFAGSTGYPDYALAIQMPKVLDSLQVDLVL